MQLLRTILIILLVYYGFKIFSKLFGPMIMKSAAKKMEKKFSQQFNQQRPQRQVRPEGEVSIDKAPETTKESNKKVGEYVDFEELE
ncbi:DUF4834 family protein [Spongiivirga citrea]|uniref:DUF4834 family protein n=1 Tax=Spongiivirga citrea TaxID=1481457 RepID=A0A6M0CFP9_9FLAO|nr:DUF4834 family protein [Spongiivirga citrea]NER16698.1 DUF4834 family protein [Spongiivirga citrea]